jgi:ATP-dependent 26S proteasome regulatory subunit
MYLLSYVSGPFRPRAQLIVQVIMATNRQDTLDPALLRPGRLDRKIEFPLPSRRERRLIFQTVTGKMNLGPDVDLEDCQSSLLCMRQTESLTH